MKLRIQCYRVMMPSERTANRLHVVYKLWQHPGLCHFGTSLIISHLATWHGSTLMTGTVLNLLFDNVDDFYKHQLPGLWKRAPESWHNILTGGRTLLFMCFYLFFFWRLVCQASPITGRGGWGQRGTREKKGDRESLEWGKRKEDQKAGDRGRGWMAVWRGTIRRKDSI